MRDRAKPFVIWIGGLMLTIVVGVVALGALWRLPARQVERYPGLRSASALERFEAENEARKTLAQVIGGAFVLLGGYVGWRTLQLGLDNQRLARDGQVTDRFSKAVEQLGSDKAAVRLGGIYALERIARDSPADHWTVMGVLCGFVREHSPRLPRAPTEPGAPPVRPATDVQAALTAIARRNATRDPRESQINLERTDLRGADFHRARLMRANLSQADLASAYLAGADLSGAILLRAQLPRADLRGALLIEASLLGVNLVDAELAGAHLEGANLLRANLEGADLINTYLEGADLSRAEGLDALSLTCAHLDRHTKLPESDQNSEDDEA